jgi:hypothetical protein
MPTHDALDVYTCGYCWQCNRHTFASRLVMAGMDLRTAAELLGYKMLQMVMGMPIFLLNSRHRRLVFSL